MASSLSLISWHRWDLIILINYFRNIADATREIISRVPRETYQNPSSEVPQSVSHHSRAPEIQSYLGNSQLHLNAFNVQVSQQKEEISVDDSFDDRVSSHDFDDSISRMTHSIEIKVDSGFYSHIPCTWKRPNLNQRKRIHQYNGKNYFFVMTQFLSMSVRKADWCPPW